MTLPILLAFRPYADKSVFVLVFSSTVFNKYLTPLLPLYILNCAFR